MDVYSLHDVPIEDLYQAIGEFIFNAIPEEWESASLYAEIEDDDSGTTYGRYKTAATADESLSFDTDYRIYLIFDELRRRTRQPNQPAWTLARFALRRDGSFDLSFEYGPLPER